MTLLPAWPGVPVEVTETSHSALDDLAADDHTQYLLANGSRDLGGQISLGTSFLRGRIAATGAAPHQFDAASNNFDPAPLTTAGTALRLGNTGATQGVGEFGAGLGFAGPGNMGQDRAAIVPVQAGADVDVVGLTFWVHPGTGTEDLVEAVRIDSNGFVGIGTTSPNEQLDVEVTTPGVPSTIRIHQADATNAASHAYLHLRTGGTGDAYIRYEIAGLVDWSIGPDADDSGKLKISESTGPPGSPRMTFEPGGQIGIGITNPSATLDIWHSVAGEVAFLRLVNSDNTNTASAALVEAQVAELGGNAIYRLDVNGIQTWDVRLNNTTNDSFTIRDNTAGADRLTILASTGLVGVGTPAPGRALDVLHFGAAQLRLASSHTDATDKTGRISIPHRTIAEEEISMISATSLTSNTFIDVGGVSSAFNAATQHRFWAAATTTTVVGTQIMNISVGGVVVQPAGVSSTAAASAALDVRSTVRGFLPPRMTTTQRDAISTPAPGLVIYNTTTGKLNVRGASAWEAVSST